MSNYRLKAYIVSISKRNQDKKNNLNLFMQSIRIKNRILEF